MNDQPRKLLVGKLCHGFVFPWESLGICGNYDDLAGSRDVVDTWVAFTWVGDVVYWYACWYARLLPRLSIFVSRDNSLV